MVTLATTAPPPPPALDLGTTLVSVDDLDPFAFNGQYGRSAFQHSIYDGDKFFGGFGTTQVQQVDYWTLRARSHQLFNENLYARGLIRRLVTNEINIGLFPEASPETGLLGMELGALDDWSETVENRFSVWGDSPQVCDWHQRDTFGAINRAARLEALVEGDVLVVLRQNSRTGAPQVQLINGSKVRSPLIDAPRPVEGRRIVEGVELDASGRHAAFWVRQDDGSTKRLPAVGPRSGRRLAWLVYGTDKRHSEVRGQPMLGLVLQSLKEIDRYRDSVQRKAVVNSVLAMFIKKTDDKPGTLPVTGGAVRKDRITATDPDGGTRKFNLAEQVPGVVMEELQTGEEPVGFHSQGTDTEFGVFEESIIQAVAWANEVPPEILRLSFSNNYSASQAAINEFKIYLNLVWSRWGAEFCTPVYTAWLVSEVLQQKVAAPGLLEAWRDPAQYDIFGSWVAVNWYGTVKPSTDMLKQAKGSKLFVDNAWSTNARESRTINGSKFSKNVQTLKRENAQLMDAMRPRAEFEKEFGVDPDTMAASAALSVAEDTLTLVEGMADG